ncbi:TetR/AcrR family transcriptional regulator [Rhizobium sp. SGZ-381]|uniref:TetR/AcrR family transcriptional regulator n=1 Tax=Rhizobium sp. SGZ-381 TaxID=3342800 RepID=UPI00366E7DB7
MARRTAYHHGDLRKALVDTGLSLLEELGLEDLSLRKIAASIGVSHAAPEHHFPSLRHLLNALAAEGFGSFREGMLSHMQAAPLHPADQLRAALRGYLAFATEKPHLFRLMFNRNRLDWEDPALGAAGEAARQVLTAICRPVADRLGIETPEGRVSIEHLVWSQAHGYAHLVIDGKIEVDSACHAPNSVPLPDLVNFLLPGEPADAKT